MKIKILIILSIGISVFSCSEDFLELSPKTNVSSISFFKTESDFEQAVVGAYEPLRNVMGEIGWMMGEMRSDNTHYEYYGGDRGPRNAHKEAIADFINDDHNSYTTIKYNNCYIGISRVNTILDNIENAEFNEEIKTQMIGEAKFLRAFYYFELVRFFGEVPLVLHEVTNPDQSYVSKSSIDNIYEVIISDVKDASDKLKVATIFPQSGRATKGAAQTLLAKIYMTLKDFTSAEVILKEITQMNYALLNDYAQVFSTTNKNNRESIFEIQFQMGDQGQQSEYIYRFIPRTPNTLVITGIVANNMDNAGWNIPSQDLIDDYEPEDLRKDISIGIVEGELNENGEFIPSGVKSIENYVPTPNVLAKSFVKKYLHPHIKSFNTDDNWPVYRYSDVLLMLAECLNENGSSGQALPFVNMVRTRAGLGSVTITDQSVLRNVIMHERRIELAFENHRWFDLVRTGRAINVMNAYGENLKSIYNYLLPGTYNISEEKLLFPIPYREVNENPNL